VTSVASNSSSSPPASAKRVVWSKAFTERCSQPEDAALRLAQLAHSLKHQVAHGLRKVERDSGSPGLAEVEHRATSSSTTYGFPSLRS